VTSKEHNQPAGRHGKHTPLTRLSGNFGRNEWAIVGGYCTTIKLLADQVIGALSPQYKCAYADTSHNITILHKLPHSGKGSFLPRRI